MPPEEDGREEVIDEADDRAAAVLRGEARLVHPLAGGADPFAAQASQAGKREVGDWLCPQCGANVFRSKTACFSCGAPKPFEAYGMPQQPMGTES